MENFHAHASMKKLSKKFARAGLIKIGMSPEYKQMVPNLEGHRPFLLQQKFGHFLFLISGSTIVNEEWGVETNQRISQIVALVEKLFINYLFNFTRWFQFSFSNGLFRNAGGKNTVRFERFLFCNLFFFSIEQIYQFIISTRYFFFLSLGPRSVIFVPSRMHKMFS